MSIDISKLFQEAANRFEFVPVGRPVFGWNQKSIGSEIRLPEGDKSWAKLFAVSTEHAKGREWEGEKFAAHWVSSWKPRVQYVHEFGDELRAQLIVSDKVKGEILGVSQHKLKENVAISDSYLMQLKMALASLRLVTTDRVNTRYDLVRRRVLERWEINVEYSECHWETIHGDLHWQNVAGPCLEIVDWEGWGIGLQHQDLAMLIAFSAADGDLVERLRANFRDVIISKNLALAEMFVTAELLRMAENYGDHPELVPELTILGERARDEWTS